MKNKVSTAFATFLVIQLMSASIQAQQPINIIGKWKGVEESDRQIEFFQEKDGSFSGKVINDKSKDPKNGVVMIKNLKYDSKTKSFKGKMSPPDKDIQMDTKIIFIGNDKIKIESSMLFMTKSFHLVRIK